MSVEAKMPQRRVTDCLPSPWAHRIKESDAIIVRDFFHYSGPFRSRIHSQTSGARTANMSRGMSRSSSEVRTKHALAGMKGHSHLVIWVNYKCCRPQGGKMSWTAVCADTHTHTHSGSPPVSMVCSLHCIQVDMVQRKFTVMAAKKFLFPPHFSFKPFRQIWD